MEPREFTNEIQIFDPTSGLKRQ